MERFPYPSTGLDHLDEMLTRLQYGDNVVWQVDDIAHYKELVVPYVNRALAEHRKTIYFRFAQAFYPDLEYCASAGFDQEYKTRFYLLLAYLSRPCSV